MLESSVFTTTNQALSTQFNLLTNAIVEGVAVLWQNTASSKN
jgi:hypothetical protein